MEIIFKSETLALTKRYLLKNLLMSSGNHQVKQHVFQLLAIKDHNQITTFSPYQEYEVRIESHGH